MAKNYFNVVDITIALVSLVTFLFDVATDIFVCIELLLGGQTVWGWLMVAFITVPAFLTSAFSLIWHIHDKTISPVIVVSHLLMVAPIERYLKVIYLGVKSYRTRKIVLTQKALRALSDVSILRLIEAFLESAPQLLLQMYVLLCKRQGSWITGISVGCSLVSLTWAMTTYCDTQCHAHSSIYRRRLCRLLVHWSWQLFMTAARIAAFVFFACAVHGWVFAVMGGHWLAAFLWISIRGTDFGTGCEKWLFRLVCAFFYIFVFLNLNEGKSRWRITAYYLLVLLENTGMLVVYLVMGDSRMILVSCLVVFAGFFMGLACMLLYYVFLHPSGSAKRIKRFFQPRLRSFNISESSQDTGPQIFSIESPKPAALIEGNPIHASHANSNSQNKVANIQQTCHIDEASSRSNRKSRTAVNSSKQTMQMVWQSGMESLSGSSSSSLASTENLNHMIKRTSSVKSDNSRSSASSDNQLLPPQLARNDLSKSPKKNLKMEEAEDDYLKRGLSRDITESENMNVLCGASQSLTLCRDSWTQLSDQKVQPLVLGDLTILGFDESSSTDKRVSDSSSFSSQSKGLSPLDVANLWKDAHVRLRATIAATIAAAMGNSSSNEGTPNRNRSITSYSSAVSGPEDSLNSTHNVTTLSHNTAFMDSSSSYRDKLNISQQTNSQDSSRHREALSTLPDIIETFDREEPSDVESRENSYEKSEAEDMENKIVREKIPSKILLDVSSPLDSTLTVSKLEIQEPSSYLASQRKRDIDCQGALESQRSCNPAVSFRSPVHCHTSAPTSSNMEACKGDSPFTDQELVTVMTKSLQNYIDGSSSVDSDHPEREGLALTLEDLCLSRESTPEPSPLSRKIGDSWKSRSASSLFHDSRSSSPASSASKMNQSVSIQNAEAKLSPNAFKQIGHLPRRLHSLDDLQESKDQVVASIPHIHALKFIMDSYESTSLINPPVATPVSQKSFHQTSPKSITPKLMAESKLKFLSHSNREISDFLPSSRGRGERMLQRRSIEKDLYPVEMNTCHENSHPEVIPDSSAWKRSKLTSQDPEVSGCAKHSEVRGGISSTKKLNVHFTGIPLLQYERSPFCKQTIQQEKESDSGSDIGGYVSGQYCPPLCGNDEVDSDENSIQRNLNHKQRNSKYDLNRVSKSVLELSSEHKKHNLETTDLDVLDSLRKEIIRRNLELEKQKYNFFSLQQSDTTPSDQKFQPSNSHPYLQFHSPTCQSDSVNIALKASPHSFNDKPRNRTFAQLQDMGELTEDELHLSAKHIAEYFSEALEANPSNPNSGSRPKKHYSQPQLQVHGCRQPLQRLENSYHLSPEANKYKIDNKFNSNKDPHSHIQNSRHLEMTNYAVSPEVFKQRSSLEPHRLQYAKDFPKAKLLFESSEPNRISSRPPLNDSRRTASRLSINRSDKSSSAVQFPIAGESDKYFWQNRHVHRKGKSDIK